MKNNPNEEKNMFQKYDDLFDEQDKKYDKNNGDRYAKKKNVRSEDVEYQRYETKKEVPTEDQDFFDKRQTAQDKNNKSVISAIISIFVLIGVLTAFMFLIRSSTTIPWFIVFIAIGSVVSLLKRRKRN